MNQSVIMNIQVVVCLYIATSIIFIPQAAQIPFLNAHGWQCWCARLCRGLEHERQLEASGVKRLAVRSLFSLSFLPGPPAVVFRAPAFQRSGVILGTSFSEHFWQTIQIVTADYP